MGMGFNIKLVVIFLFCSSLLFSLSKEDRVIKASLYPYIIKGITYYPHSIEVGTKKTILASWYGGIFHGRKTAIGEIYDMYAYTAAHKTYPLGTVLLVTNPKNGKSLTVRINDRGPFWNKRELDLSMASAEFLDTKDKGVAEVDIEVLSVPKIAQGFKPSKKYKPRKPVYNVGYTATSYSNIGKNTKKVFIEIGTFLKKKQADKYLKKFHKHFSGASIFEDNYNYKIKFSMVSNENIVKKRLKKLKKIGLISGYGLCWSYD